MKALLESAFCLSVICSTAQAGDINWRVSVKFILDANGNWPADGSINTDAEVQAQIGIGNDMLDVAGRGYQLDLTEIVDVAGASQWFSATINTTTRTNLEAAAEADPATYAWRDDQINVYILGSGGSGICSFPEGSEIIVVGQGLRTTTILHEVGHYFDLCHTQGCPCGSCAGSTGVCNTTPGDDRIADTLPDLSCWDQDAIAQWSFSVNYADLTAAQQARVDTVFFNVMSYHTARNRYSPDQLDVTTDMSNGFRNYVATGTTYFVDDDAGASQSGTSDSPFATVAQGLAIATGNDIVLVRAGVYPETQTINQRVCLRATRGTAVIGLLSRAEGSKQPAPPLAPNYPDTFDGRTGP